MQRKFWQKHQHDWHTQPENERKSFLKLSWHACNSSIWQGWNMITLLQASLVCTSPSRLAFEAQLLAYLIDQSLSNGDDFEYPALELSSTRAPFHCLCFKVSWVVLCSSLFPPLWCATSTPVYSTSSLDPKVLLYTIVESRQLYSIDSTLALLMTQHCPKSTSTQY